MRTFIILLNTVWLPLVFSATRKRADAHSATYQSSSTHQFLFAEDTLEHTHGKIIFSSIIFRHGDRNPVGTFPTDQYGEHFKEAGFGKLIKAGKERAYRLGAWARARYADLIPEGQISTTLKVYSSDIDRTLESAQMFLAAFCPPQSDEEMWNSTLPWQPIPIHTISLSVDNFIVSAAPCPRMSWEMNAAKELPFLKTFYKNLTEPILTHLENSTQSEFPRTDPVLGVIQISKIYDTLNSQQQLGLKLPTWVRTVYPKPLASVLEKLYQLLTSSNVSKKLNGGPLIERMISSMVNKRETAAKNEFTTNIFDVYSGHDTTITILLNSLGMYNGDSPQYSAAVFVELRYKENEYFVTVLYRNSEEKAPILLKLPNCEYPCSLDEFIKITKPIIPNDWNKECNIIDPDYNAMRI